MSDSNQNQKEAWNYFEKIKNALSGLLEILTMGFDKDDVIFKAGIENLKHLKESIADLLEHEYKPEQIKRKIRDLEFDIKMKLFFNPEDDEDTGDKEEQGAVL